MLSNFPREMTVRKSVMLMGCLAMLTMAAGAPAQADADTTPTATVAAPQDPVARAMTIAADTEAPVADRRRELQALANSNADSAEVWAAYGEVLNAAGEGELALRAFERASQLDPKLYTPWFWIGTLKKRGTPKPDYPAAEAAFRKALEAGSEKPQTLNELAVTLALQGKMDEAVSMWRRAVRQDPQWGVLYTNLMKAASGKRDEAMADGLLADAIAAERFEETSVLIYGTFMADRQRPEKAESAYRRAIAKHPDRPRLHFYLGTALAAQNRKDEALAELRRAREMAVTAGDNAEIIQSTDWEVFRIQFPEEEKQFQEARMLVFGEVADARQRDRNMKKAIGILDKVLARRGDFWNGFFVRGVANRRIDNRPAARADLQRVLDLHPDEPNATMELALLERDERNFARAADLAERATTLAPRDPLFAVNAGLILIEAGRCGKAWEQYGRAVRMVGEQNAAILRDELELRCKE